MPAPNKRLAASWESATKKNRYEDSDITWWILYQLLKTVITE